MQNDLTFYVSNFGNMNQTIQDCNKVISHPIVNNVMTTFFPGALAPENFIMDKPSNLDCRYFHIMYRPNHPTEFKAKFSFIPKESESSKFCIEFSNAGDELVCTKLSCTYGIICNMILKNYRHAPIDQIILEGHDLHIDMTRKSLFYQIPFGDFMRIRNFKADGSIVNTTFDRGVVGSKVFLLLWKKSKLNIELIDILLDMLVIESSVFYETKYKLR